MRKLKSGKAGGVCGIQVEMVKAGGYTVVQWLKDILDIAWNCGKTPHEWRKAIIVPIYKKGSKAECGNYRGISLLCGGKDICKGGFRVCRGCVD